MSGSDLRKRKRDDDLGIPRLTGVKYDVVTDREIVDKRFERERSNVEVKAPAAVSSTFDAFQRMAAGLDSRTIADKIANPNRPTWEQYKKENEDKLDLVGTDVRKMVEYRAELDRERDKLLKQQRRQPTVTSDDSDAEEENSDSSSRKKKKSKKHKKEKKSKKSKKKHKKDGKDRKKSDYSDNSSSEESNSNEGK